MKKFFELIAMDFKLVQKPESVRIKAVETAKLTGWKIYLVFILPVMLIASFFDSLHYYQIDGIQTGILSILSYFILYAITGGIFISGANFIARFYKANNKVFLFSLAYVIFWIFLGDIIYSVAIMIFGILGRFMLSWFLKLGAIWIANYALNEMVFGSINLEVSKLKKLANWMTLLWFGCAFGIPFILEKIIEKLAMYYF